MIESAECGVLPFVIPELPAGKSLKQEHLQSVFHYGTVYSTFFHKQRLVWIVDQIIEKRMVVHGIVWEIRTLISMRIHAAGSAVDDHVILLDGIGSDVAVLNGTGLFVSAYLQRLESK